MAIQAKAPSSSMCRSGDVGIVRNGPSRTSDKRDARVQAVAGEARSMHLEVHLVYADLLRQRPVGKVTFDGVVRNRQPGAAGVHEHPVQSHAS